MSTQIYTKLTTMSMKPTNQRHDIYARVETVVAFLFDNFFIKICSKIDEFNQKCICYLFLVSNSIVCEICAKKSRNVAECDEMLLNLNFWVQSVVKVRDPKWKNHGKQEKANENDRRSINGTAEKHLRCNRIPPAGKWMWCEGTEILSTSKKCRKMSTCVFEIVFGCIWW